MSLSPITKRIQLSFRENAREVAPRGRDASVSKYAEGQPVRFAHNCQPGGACTYRSIVARALHNPTSQSSWFKAQGTQIIPVLIGFAYNRQLSLKAADAFGMLAIAQKRAAVPKLIQLLNDRDAGIRGFALSALLVCGDVSKSLTGKAILSVLTNPCERNDIRILAAMAIEKWKYAPALPVLIKLVKNHATHSASSDACSLYRGPYSNAISIWAARALRAIGSKTRAVADALLAGIASDNLLFRWVCTEALGDLFRNARSIDPIIVKGLIAEMHKDLKDPKRQLQNFNRVWRRPCIALGKIGKAVLKVAPNIIDVLEKVFQAKSEPYKEMVIRAVGGIYYGVQRPDPKAIVLLARAVRLFPSSYESYHREALFALVGMGNAGLPELTRIANDPTVHPAARKLAGELRTEILTGSKINKML